MFNSTHYSLINIILWIIYKKSFKNTSSVHSPLGHMTFVQEIVKGHSWSESKLTAGSNFRLPLFRLPLSVIFFLTFLLLGGVHYWWLGGCWRNCRRGIKALNGFYSDLPTRCIKSTQRALLSVVPSCLNIN